MQTMASWIWVHAAFSEESEYVLFRKTVQLEHIPSALPLQVTADSRYILCVNGQFVSRGPARSVPSVTYYDTVDIAPYLHPGCNVLTIDAVHYGGDRHAANDFRAGPIGIPSSTRGGVLVDGDSRFCTGEGYRCKRLTAYRFKKAEIAGYLGFFEELDGREYPVGWREATFDDSNWSSAIPIIGNVPFVSGGLANVWQVAPRPIPPVFQRPIAFARVTRSDGVSGNVLEEGVTVAPDTAAFVELDAGVYCQRQ